MRTKTLYHGTKFDARTVMNNPLMKGAANGHGLYLTDSKDLAYAYGEVVAFIVPWDFEPDIMRMVKVDIYIKGVEYVINNQATYVKFLKSIEDAYIV